MSGSTDLGGFQGCLTPEAKLRVQSKGLGLGFRRMWGPGIGGSKPELGVKGSRVRGWVRASNLRVQPLAVCQACRAVKGEGTAAGSTTLAGIGHA